MPQYKLKSLLIIHVRHVIKQWIFDVDWLKSAGFATKNRLFNVIYSTFHHGS